MICCLPSYILKSHVLREIGLGAPFFRRYINKVMQPTTLTGKGPRRRNCAARGLTLLEVLVAVAILSIGVLSFIGTFAGISKSIRVSKSKTIATNLDQEKIEYLKNI